MGWGGVCSGGVGCFTVGSFGVVRGREGKHRAAFGVEFQMSRKGCGGRAVRPTLWSCYRNVCVRRSAAACILVLGSFAVQDSERRRLCHNSNRLMRRDLLLTNTPKTAGCPWPLDLNLASRASVRPARSAVYVAQLPISWWTHAGNSVGPTACCISTVIPSHNNQFTPPFLL